MRTVLAIGAHYDDVELGVGCILQKHVEAEDNIYIVITSSDEQLSGSKHIREAEQYSAMKILGISQDNLILFNEDDALSRVIGELDRLNPDLVYGHYGKDTHQAHRRAHNIANAISRKPGIELLYYNSGSAYDFLPTVFSEVGEVFKLELLTKFDTQIKKRNINIEAVEKREGAWGLNLKQGGRAEALLPQKLEYKL